MKSKKGSGKAKNGQSTEKRSWKKGGALERQRLGRHSNWPKINVLKCNIGFDVLGQQSSGEIP